MPNVKGKQVSDGSHNVVYREAVGSEIANLTVDVVEVGENVRFKIAGVGEIANALIEMVGFGVPFTVDSTLYTSDSILITVDKTEI